MISVLYVDDESSLLEIARIYLQASGEFTLDTLTSATGALSVLNSRQYDVIISDYQMPEMDGIAFIRALRQRGNTTPFIIFTGKGREEIVIQALNEGVDFYVQKGGEPKSQYAELQHKLRLAVERKRSEQALKESEEKLAAVVAGSPVPKFVLDQNHRIISWNRALELMTGISASTVVGTRDHWRAFYAEERPTMADLILDGAHKKIRELYAEKIVNSPVLPDAVDVIDFFPHLGEKGRWLRFMASPIRNEQGGMIGAVETLIDITPIKNSEEELRKSCAMIAAAEEELRHQFDEMVEKEVRLHASEERYRQFIETANEGVWSMDDEFCTTFVNERLAEMLGYLQNEMIGRPITAFMHPDDLADNARRLADRQQGRAGRYERRFLHKNGTTVYTLVSATPLFSGGIFTGSFAMITDISDRIAAEDALRLANRRLMLMSSVTRHDLLNTIISSRGYLAMARHMARDPGLLEILGRLETVTDVMEAQISFTRVYQDIGSSPPLWQDIGMLVQGCKSVPGTRIVSDISHIEVLADPLITNVFTNLLDNSLRHGEQVSEIHVHTETGNNGLVIVWEDNGTGIPENEKELIFDRGYGKNTGLGLFLVREILSITGITIRENGEPGKGARFEISLPQDRFRIVPSV